MRRRFRQMHGMGALASPASSPASAQPVNSIGDFFGNLGNSWQGGEDAPMYGGGTSPGGVSLAPFATAQGATNFEAGASQAAGQAWNAATGWIPSASSIETWLIVGGIFFLLVELSPTINNLSSRR